MEKSLQKKIFEILIKGYYDNKFEAAVNIILSTWSYPKEELKNTIAAVCGVSSSLDHDNFIASLKEAIAHQERNSKIVVKTGVCDDCEADQAGLRNCEKSCPFNAISIDPKTGLSYINSDCTDCGLCVDSCDSGNIMDKIEFMPFAKLLRDNSVVIATVAPAICGQFGEDVSLDMLRTAFKKIGFADMIEVAFFADMLTIKEATEFNHFVSDKDDLMITSCCCPVWIAMLKKVYKDLIKYVSPSVSPMIASGRVLKRIYPGCKVVFVGPCIAKKAEIKEDDLIGDIDYVLTFEELKSIFDALNIDPSKLEPTPTTEYASKGGRSYGRTGGVSAAVNDAVEFMFPEKHHLLKTMQAHGVKECRSVLKEVQDGKISANFIEGMGCIGGCVGGPKRLIPWDRGTDLLNEFCDKSKYSVPIESECMKNILEKININSIEDFSSKEKTAIFERDF